MIDRPHDNRGIGPRNRIVWYLGVAHQPVIFGGVRRGRADLVQGSTVARSCHLPHLPGSSIVTDVVKETCPHCREKHPLTKEGFIVSHSWPRPTRQLCRGAGYSSVEAHERCNIPVPDLESDE